MQNFNEEHAKLNASQRQAVNATKGPVLVVAGAGTGKTRVIVERINHLIATGTLATRVLALTFTEKAALEMQDRLNQAAGTYQPELPIMTFNAFGEAMLRRYAADIGLARNFTLMGENSQIVFLRERLDQLKLDYFAPVSNPDGQLTNISSYFSHLKQHVITPEVYKKFASAMPATTKAEIADKTKHIELSSAYQAYIDLSRTANVIDYDDQIYLLIELLQKRPNVLKEIQDSYDYILVDEFQDTNAMQSVMVDMIAGEQKNLFVVGDDDQSIYGWRGATLANILDFKDRYHGAKEITLIENYRSTKEVLDAAYQLIRHNNPHRLEERLHIDKRLTTKRSGKPPQVYVFKTLDGELHWIAEDIQRRIDEGVPLGSIAVLARRNATVKRLHDQLEFTGIDHVVVGQRFELYHEPIVRNLLSAIKATVDPLDNTSLYHTLTGPLFSLPVHTISQAAGTAKRLHQSLYDAITDSTDKALKNAKTALEQINTWREKSANLSIGQLTYEILESSGYKQNLYQAAMTDPTTAVAISRMAELFHSMKEFELVALQPSALQYVDALPALQAAGDSAQDDTLDLSGEKVNILSVHKAKGLEWPIVYIADCSEGSFPLRETARGIVLPEGLIDNQNNPADEHMAEERRLMYVAMTRAKDELVLTYAERHSAASVRKPSRFLAEAFGNDSFTAMQPDSEFDLASINTFGSTTPSAVPIPESILNGQHVNLSISQVKKYQDCPFDFYYRYILNVPQESSPAQTYGVLIHSLIEDMNRSLAAGKLLPLGELTKRLISQWPMTGYLSTSQRDRALAQGKATLEKLYKRMSASPRIPVAIEEPFRVTLEDCQLSLRGRFDAVLPLGTGIEIVDYKTSTSVDSPEKAKQRANSSEQLTLYALAWQLLHGPLPELVTLDFVDTGLLGSIKKTQRGIDSAYLRLQKVADGVRSQDFKPGKDHAYCVHPPV